MMMKCFTKLLNNSKLNLLENLSNRCQICCKIQSNYRSLHSHVRLSNEEVQKKRIELYDKEVQRQQNLITDIEKIYVNFKGAHEKATLVMNKNISTPYNCAQHITQNICDSSVLAEVNGKEYDMHRPLTEDCELIFHHFKEDDPFYVNKAFWRSCSLMLGAVLESGFNNDIYVQLCSFPGPNVRTGSFIYDVDLPIEWTPTKDELRVLSTEMVKLSLAKLTFQALQVDASVALRIFEDNRYKKMQIPHIAANSESGNDVTLYRFGSFVDLSRGPCVANTGILGKVSIAGVFPFELEGGQRFYRFQGVALPSDFMMNHYTYSILEERARRLNKSPLPDVSALEQAPMKRMNSQEVAK